MSSKNGSLPAQQTARSAASNRQSVHNGLSARDGSTQQGVPAFTTSVVPSSGKGQPYPGQQQGDVGRVTPQPAQAGEDMSEEDVNQLIKDHKELRMSSTLYHTATDMLTRRDRREVYQGQEILL